MADLNTKSFTTLVQDQAAAVQGAATTLLDFTIGSVLRAMIESNSSVALWLQALILRLLTTTRAATSSGADLDTWVADYGLTRLPADASTGTLSFTRFTTTTQAVIPIGAQVQTTDGSQIFTVYADLTNSAYSVDLGGYVVGIGVASLDVPAQANTPGAAGNVLANTITAIFTSISGIDTANNAAAFLNGADAESDAALRVRFVNYIASLARATKSAISFAISTVQQGLTWTITENSTKAGAYLPGFFFVTVDDGTGSPPASLISAVYRAVDAYRPIATSFAVYAPTVITGSVNVTITTAAGYNHATVVGQVGVAIQNFINSLGLGQPLPYTRLAQIAYGASPGVSNVYALTLNSGTSDLVPTVYQIIQSGTITVS